MHQAVEFHQAARLPGAGDNVAIATRRLNSGTRLKSAGGFIPIGSTVLEGHRFAVMPILPGEWLYSWGLPFGRCIRPVAPGDYVCNAQILRALSERHVDFDLPTEPNFRNETVPFELKDSTFQAGIQVPLHASPGTFEGYVRPGFAEAGTRNFIAVLGTSSRSAGFARSLARLFNTVSSEWPGLDGVVALAHTEGGGARTPNNLRLSLRTLAGMVGHPNLAAILAVDAGDEPLNNSLLMEAIAERWPGGLKRPAAFLSLKQGWQSCLDAGRKLIEGWLPLASAAIRSKVPLKRLKIGLQCGGSDAFSGVSGNPLIGWMARELIQHGGVASLAETDELIGAEPYVLSNVKDIETARAFLRVQRRFQEWAGWHGHSAEGNPSGGNMFRGLYNIAIKSIGAGRKKDPAVRLDHVIDFGEPMPEPGFYFMDSPGNDLESIAGQVASGCNLILFATGNGSITNFPFVPTIKVMTSSPRFRMLSREMDINAGRYLDGESMDDLGLEAFQQMVRVSGGERTAGECAGHSQLQLWREWRQTGPSVHVVAKNSDVGPEPSSVLLQDGKTAEAGNENGLVRRLAQGLELTHLVKLRHTVNLVLPTSLCAGQIAGLAVNELNSGLIASGSSPGFVHLPHTEGCGNSGGESERILMRVMTGHLAHPRIWSAVLMEHGCEKTHNDSVRNWIRSNGGETSRFGWVSIQMDGGIDASLAKVRGFFEMQSDSLSDASSTDGNAPPCIGFAGAELLSGLTLDAASLLLDALLTRGVPVILGSGLDSNLAQIIRHSDATLRKLACGERVFGSGLHLMDSPTDHLVEIWTALAASGAECILSFGTPLHECHPFVPVVQVGSDADLDLDRTSEDPGSAALELVKLLGRAGMKDPMDFGDRAAFQLTRGLEGVSL